MKLFFVATVKFAVNSFLLSHLRVLSKYYEITVIVNCDDACFLKMQGLEVNVIPVNFSRDVNLLVDVWCLVRLFLILVNHKPHAVHSITPKAGLLAMLAAFFARVPYRFHTFTGQVWVNQKGFKRWFLKIMDYAINKLSTFNIIDSQSQRDFLIREGVLTIEKSIVFGSGSVSGVNLEKFEANSKVRGAVRKQLSIPSNAFVYVYLGRLTKDKGLLDLASAFSKIRDDRAYLVVVGPDEEGLSRQIACLVAENQNRLRMIGFSSEPQRYLSASDVLCLPSYREGFGSVIIEAAAMGVPAIASNIYGISDAVQNHKTGLLHPPKDVDAILTCMEKFLLDSKLVKSYGLAAKKRAVSEFDAKLLSQYWLDFYLGHVH